MKKHSTLKTLFKIGSLGLVALGVIEMGKIIEDEKNGDFSALFPDKEDEIKETIKKVKLEKIKEKGEQNNE